MTHDINEIKDKVKEIMASTPNLTGVSFGHKIANGQQTGDLSIVYFVKEKKPLSELSPEEVIPSEIMLSTGPIKTDVKKIKEVKTLACNANCGQIAGPNSLVNRSVVRPLKGGASMTSANNVSTVGTLGFIAVHSETQALVGVTNNHVSIQDAFYTDDRSLSGIIENEYITDYIYQNGENGFIPPSSYQIGQSLRYVPIYQTGSGVNTVDAAMFSIEEEDVDDTVSFKQIGEEAYAFPYPFATTAEIDDLLTTNPMLYSSGRTTGPKGGVSCPMRVSGLNAVFYIYYYKQGTPTLTLFSDCIEFVKPANDPDISTICINPIIPGDSGSALIADFDGERKIIGLVFASGGDGFYGYACRIDEVASQLGIESWDGTPKNYIDPNTIEYVTVPGGNFDKILTCNGKDYWQVGLSMDVNECVTTTTTCCPVTDIIIGTQTWSSCNLSVTTYANGDPIPEVIDPAVWISLTTGAWCYYNNDPSTECVYGRLYNQYAVNDSRGLAPTGYHIPTTAEWNTLRTYLGGSLVAGGELKEVGTAHWNSPNVGATNSTGFAALPTIFRANNDGNFYSINQGIWWTFDIYDNFSVYGNSTNMGNNSYDRRNGFSVRIIKD